MSRARRIDTYPLVALGDRGTGPCIFSKGCMMTRHNRQAPLLLALGLTLFMGRIENTYGLHRPTLLASTCTSATGLHSHR